MRCFTRLAVAAIALASVTGSAVAQGVTLDPAIIAFKLPDQIEWKPNAAGTNRTAVLQGDPAKPGPYAMLLQWKSLKFAFINEIKQLRERRWQEMLSKCSGSNRYDGHT